MNLFSAVGVELPWALLATSQHEYCFPLASPLSTIVPLVADEALTCLAPGWQVSW